jgi:Uncharacterised nucleotidyltransferase
VKAPEWLLFKVLSAEPIKEIPFDANGHELFFTEIMDAGLGPAFYLLAKNCPFLPEQVRSISRKSYEDSLLFKDYAVCCLRELQPELCKFGRVVIIKGLALCETVYREPCTRPMGDVDLYFPDDSIDEARMVFFRNGYTCLDGYRDVVCKGELHVDLHEDLWSARRIPRRKCFIPHVAETFEPSALVPGFLVPSPSLLAEHSSYHAIKHCFSRKLWYLDIVIMCKQGYFKEPGPMALIALDQCRRIGLIRRAFAKPRLASFKRTFLQMLFSMKERPGTGELALALSLPKFSDSILYLAESLVPRREILMEMYGNHLFVFLLARRIIVLASYTLEMVFKQPSSRPSPVSGRRSI